ncbi:MAG: hypothetical protein ACRDTJ_07145 [Pseudonocardiaceae bacterium]
MGLSGRVPRRRGAATKAGLLDLPDEALEARLDTAPDLSAAGATRAAGAPQWLRTSQWRGRSRPE